MPTYWVEGSMRYNVKVVVVADTPEQAVEIAENDDWSGIAEEGRWKDAFDFKTLDKEESVQLIEDDDEVDDPYENELGEDD